MEVVVVGREGGSAVERLLSLHSRGFNPQSHEKGQEMGGDW